MLCVRCASGPRLLVVDNCSPSRSQGLSEFNQKVDNSGLKEFLKKQRVRCLHVHHNACVYASSLTPVYERHALQYRVKPTVVRQRNASDRQYFVRKKAVEAQFAKLIVNESVGDSSGF